MDVLLNIAGTPYDGTLDFIEKYKNDGIIWYLESFDLHFEQMMEGLWKMREMGCVFYSFSSDVMGKREEEEEEEEEEGKKKKEK